jgi:hypothetical protein
MLQLSPKWASVLIAQPETGMGYQIATISLVDGRRFSRVTLVGGLVTKVGESDIVPFREDDIAAILVDHGK